MEASREERQQMRQRGAATRKAREVNFGFSFESTANTDHAKHNTTAVEGIATRIASPGVERTPGSARNKLPERPSTYEIPSSDDRSEQTRSNKRRKTNPTNGTEDTPSRRNTGRIENADPHPVDNSAGSTESQTSHAQEFPNTAHSPSEITNNQSTQPHIPPIAETSVQDQHPIEERTNDVGPTTSATGEKIAQDTSPVSDLTAPEVAEELQVPLSSPEAQAGVEQPKNIEQLYEKRQNTRSPPRSEERIQGNNVSELATSAITSSIVQADNSVPESLSPRGSSAEVVKVGHVLTADDDVEMTEDVLSSNDEQPEQANQTSQGPSTTSETPQGRPHHQPTAENATELQVQDAIQEPTTRVQDKTMAAQVEGVSKTKRPRGRPSLHKKTIEAIETENTSPEPIPDVAESSSGPRRGREPTSQKDDQPESLVESSVPKPRRGRPVKKANHVVELGSEAEPVTADQAEPEMESALPEPKRGRSGKKAKRAAETDLEPEPEPATADEPQPEPVMSKSRGRPRKKTREAAEHETEVQLEPEVETTVSSSQRGMRGKKANRAVEPEPEPENVTKDQPEHGAVSAAPKSQRGRPGKKVKRAAEPEPEPETEYQPEAEPVQEQPRRKAREPRGETVPVTVYRLANVNSLGGITSTADGSEDEESADELTTHQKAKIPNRGGVNPADVLSQICRETLEKTLNTLKDGIANEANATRRAEWSRKRKAVEVFGSELESRLMDLSGILDSNFVLGVQLKKTKREMMDLRNHLYRVRRERENIALQMDSVRSRHIEEEKAKSSRSTISNSLHSLELALDRNKQRSASVADSPADLEYMLRTVADVSSRAPGAQGGLLNQIRAFNAQLEATVGRLER
ncbi:uncharacterized protein N7500_004908 [Penicillium coprophilum]|uniref:uncharacterized protein n=1 Tax=Penicillium coprophilum TaxID=36646 RepID=UPI0023A3F60D|nr:uncharacterized protein N7500_004908 [Penicillium coprophilum]KAJ5163078.1 hypothetical protein N7500_004908 [Penicillium coprophilum]